MKITYIHHSCFSVELDKCILLFDYFKGKLPEFNKDKKLYIFSSHSHYDHFDKSIFKIEKSNPNVTYILSNDINAHKADNRIFIGANERLSLDNMEVRTLESSDLGVAFIVKIENKTISLRNILCKIHNTSRKVSAGNHSVLSRNSDIVLWDFQSLY